jgi:polyhydroxyalkanoate synthesis regulator phasin
MNDVFKKMFFTSLGMAALSKAKMEEFAKDYANIYQKSESEGAKIYNDMMGEAAKASSDLENKMKTYMEEALKTMNIATSERVAQLEQRIKELEDKLASKA